MHSDETWHLRRLQKSARAICREDRIVDFGIELFTVEQDPEGVEIRPDGPRVVSIREPELFGGIYDTTVGEMVDESKNPVRWFVSAEQRPLLVGEDTPLQTLVEGGEGAGKTALLARWLALQAVRLMGRGLEFGCTAPTQARLHRVRQAMVECMPEEWYSYRQRDWLFTFAGGGHFIRLVSAHQKSKAEGSPIQGYDWAGGGADETQDQLEVIEDIRARGRRAIGGLFPMMMTATFKAVPSYRTFRDRWMTGKRSDIRKLPGQTNVYVDREFWEARKDDLTDREYRRRVLSEDVGPERMTYYSWLRARNLRPIPRIGAEPVTTALLSRWGNGFGMLGGHDPGNLWRVSELLRAYKVVGIERPVWWVVDEISSPQCTTEQHVEDVLKRLRDKWGMHRLDWKGRPSESTLRALFRADPWTDLGNDNKQPDRVVYKHFSNAGIRIMPARLKASTTVIKPLQIPKNAGIEMINTLLFNANHVVRLCVDCDERREPVAPKLVEAFEMSQNDELGRAETQKKDEDDLSHWPAALRYALWELEKPRKFVDEQEAA